ncbi:hypothetical protein [Cyclobacterium amurskyense]|nr:hypothetical protein [Cyclobacterium amurskyense]
MKKEIKKGGPITKHSDNWNSMVYPFGTLRQAQGDVVIGDGFE